MVFTQPRMYRWKKAQIPYKSMDIVHRKARGTIVEYCRSCKDFRDKYVFSTKFQKSLNKLPLIPLTSTMNFTIEYSL